jgi:regulator of nucleoside diphosphate kinase
VINLCVENYTIPLIAAIRRFFRSVSYYHLSFGMDTAFCRTMNHSEKQMVVTLSDYQRLLGLMEFSSLKSRDPEIADRLIRGLKSAKMLFQENIPPAIVTMNSRVLLVELSGGSESELTISYPHDSNSEEGRISIVSPAGVALFGSQEGEVVSWRIPSGLAEFKLKKVIYQPEAAGDYYL